MKKLNRIDMNLLVYLEVLLREKSVTRAAQHLGISQPAMSNGLRRLRELLGDPLLVRTSGGMSPTGRAQELEPLIRDALRQLEIALATGHDFDPKESRRVFRIMASDYTESTLIPPLLRRMREDAPGITLDIMTPSDVSYTDVEQGKIDMVINRFTSLPQSFHQITVWSDHFCCMMSPDNPIAKDFNLRSYMDSQHVWVSKTGFGVGVGVNPDDVQRLGFVDEVLGSLGEKRQIRVFTRHYQAAVLMAEVDDLVVTIPSRLAHLQRNNPNIVVKAPPFDMPPLTLKMVWSPLLHHDPAHKWMRGLVAEVAATISEPQF